MIYDKNTYEYVSPPGDSKFQICLYVSPSKATMVVLNIAIMISKVPSLFKSARTGGTITPEPKEKHVIKTIH